jgi:hypothetical protein
MASWKKVIMEDSAAALSSLTLTTALAVAQGGTGATSVAGVISALGLGTAATTAATAYATAAQGTKADAAMPKSGGAFTGAVTTNSTIDGVDIATRDGVLTTTTTTANAALPKAGGTMSGDIVFNSTQAKGNGGLVPAVGNAGEFLKHDGSFGTPAYSTGQLTTEEVQDIAGGLVATGGTKTGITVTYDDTNGNMDFEVAGTYLNSNVTLGTLGAQASDAGLTSIAGLTTAANKMIYTTASDTYATTTLSAFARTFLDDASATAVRSTLGVVNNAYSTAHGSVSDVLLLGNGSLSAAAASTSADLFVGYDHDTNEWKYITGNAGKSMVGLGNATNTSDANKPVSTAQQTALNLKANLAGPTFTGTTNAAALTTTGNVIVGGNLTVSGTTTTVNTETIDLADNFINLNSNASGTPSQDAGISIDRGSSTDANLFWDEGVDRWSLSLANLGGSDTASTPDAYVGVIQQATTAAASLAAPVYGGTAGLGTIYVKTDTSDVYIYA